MAKKSAGILMYRFVNSELEVFLIHPGGPFWSKKDAGAWSIPKGELEEGEDPQEAAKREFKEETGCAVEGNFIPLSPLKQPGGKVIIAWAVDGDCDAKSIRSNTFSMEWPPGSGKRRDFPEVDRAEWFGIPRAREKIRPGQRPFLEELLRKLETGI